jgi:organic hydroperoxide reductase OsmC/OhrA
LTIGFTTHFTGARQPTMTTGAHEYTARLIWDGNTGEGTARYAAYGRQYRVLVAGKPELAGTADPAFRGEADRHNPEDLFLAAVSACHMLFYLSLCARQGVRVLAYADDARGRMRIHADGGGRFEAIALRPTVTVADGTDTALAVRLHETAHDLCFIANSCSVPIRCEPTVQAQ